MRCHISTAGLTFAELARFERRARPRAPFEGPEGDDEEPVDFHLIVYLT
jgi:hypothetical protein